MSYIVFGYGSYNVPEDVTDIRTKEEAMNILHKEIQEWCNEQEININDTDYYEVDDIFFYEKEEYGVCVIGIWEVPSFKNEVNQCLWNAKIEAEMAYFASEDYKWTLSDCCVDCYSIAAQQYIDKAVALMGGWNKEKVMDDTMEFIKDLIRETEDKRLEKILRCIVQASPSEDFTYGDWNDRQDFMENEYDDLVKETTNELEKIIGGK